MTPRSSPTTCRAKEVSIFTTDNGMDIEEWTYHELVIMVNDFKTAYDSGSLTNPPANDDYQYDNYDHGGNDQHQDYSYGDNYQDHGYNQPEDHSQNTYNDPTGGDWSANQPQSDFNFDNQTTGYSNDNYSAGSHQVQQQPTYQQDPPSYPQDPFSHQPDTYNQAQSYQQTTVNHQPAPAPVVEKKPPPKPVEESQKTKDLTNKFISDFASTFTSMGTKAKNSNVGQKAMKATGNAYDAGKAQASKWMSDDQKKKVDQAQKTYTGVQKTSKFVHENKKAVGFMGNLMGYEEETKNAIKTAEVLNAACSTVDAANSNIRRAQRGESDSMVEPPPAPEGAHHTPSQTMYQPQYAAKREQKFSNTS